jgi:LemA protein
MQPVYIFAGFAVFICVAWAIGTYNRFIKYRNKIEESWSVIDVALKRRFNLISNLIKTVEGYSDHEAKIFETSKDYLTRTSGVTKRAKEETQLSESLRGLLAFAEAYPDLKASENYIDLQNNLDEIEEDIQKARNQFNRHVRQFNTLIDSFPAVFIARRFGFEKQNYFTLDLATQRELPEVEFNNETK